MRTGAVLVGGREGTEVGDVGPDEDGRYGHEVDVDREVSLEQTCGHDGRHRIKRTDESHGLDGAQQDRCERAQQTQGAERSQDAQLNVDEVHGVDGSGPDAS